MSVAPTEPNSRPFEPGPPLEPDGQPLQLAGDRLRVLKGADLAGRAGPLDQVDLLLRRRASTSIANPRGSR